MAVTGLIGVGFRDRPHGRAICRSSRAPSESTPTARLLHGPLAELLWVVRVVLLARVVLHVLAAFQLTLRDRAARPVAYARREPQVVDPRRRARCLGRRAAARLHRLPHPPLHHRAIRPGGMRVHRRATSTHNIVASFQHPVGGRVLRRLDARAGPAPLSRRVELHAHTRLRAPVAPRPLRAQHRHWRSR